MSVMGQMMKAKKTEITDKLRQEINKARLRSAASSEPLRLGLTAGLGVGGEPVHRHRSRGACSGRALHR